jgi:primosomal protein N'
MKENLSKGIEDYIFVLHGDMTEKKILETWKKISEIDHGIIVISTPLFSALPRKDIETIIIERENSRGWISQRSPFVDYRYAIESMYTSSPVKIHIADTMLRTETLYRKERHDIGEGSPFKWRSISNAIDQFVDMSTKISSVGEIAPLSRFKEEHPENDTEIDTDKLLRNFRILSKDLEEIIRQNSADDTHLFILASRRGLAPTTICGDCEHIVTCNQCSSPVVLHTSKESERNFFMCHICGSRRSADELCKTCGGWKLVPLGIGTRTVRDEINRIFPNTEVIVIDADETKTEKQIQDALRKFMSKPGSILVGTETALLHIREKVEHTAIASMDSFFALPDFRTHEKVMYILTRMRALATRTFIVQTRRSEEKVFEYGTKGNISDFYRDTLEERKQFDFPPFSRLIKLTIEGKKDSISKQMQIIRDMLSPHNVEIFPAFTSTVRGNFVIHGLIKVLPVIWPDRSLVDKLRELPSNVTIKIDPESLL